MLTTPKTIATMAVSLFSPFSIPFLLEKSWEEPPREASPSPFGEWSNINIISNIAEIICIICKKSNI